MNTLQVLVLEGYDRIIRLQLCDLAVDEVASPRPLAARGQAGAWWIGVNKASNARRSSTLVTSSSGPWRLRPIAAARRL